MKQLTRQEVEAVVEMLQEKDECMDPRYCVVCKRRRNTQITIGHTLSRIDKTVGGRNYYIGQTTYNDELIHLWSRCGELTQSLQEIVDTSGYMIYTDLVYAELMVLKSPEANALFSFLQHLI